jgi:AcrR family transcriptional regulator
MVPMAGSVRRRPVQQRSIDRYERILDCCAELLDDVGYTAATTKEIARRAGVPIGTIYQFFPDKVALVGALAVRNLDAYLARLGVRLEAEPPRGIADLVDAAVEEFVVMKRTVPGFGVVDFGAGGRSDGGLDGQDHILDEVMDNNEAVAVRLRELCDSLFGPAQPDLAIPLRVALECADGVLKLAFRIDPKGDPRIIAECKILLCRYLDV